MASLNDALRGALGAEDLARLNSAADQKEYDDASETLAGTGLAASLLVGTTILEVDGTDAYTLADGEVGQRKTFICTAAANTPDGTLTPANFGNGSTITFDAVGETATLEFRAGNWWVVSISGATVA